MRNRSRQRGFFTFEAAVAIATLAFAFIVLLGLVSALWNQMQAQNVAITLGRQAARVAMAPGTRGERALSGGGSARVTWGSSEVTVEVERPGVRGRVMAVHVEPREVP